MGMMATYLPYCSKPHICCRGQPSGLSSFGVKVAEIHFESKIVKICNYKYDKVLILTDSGAVYTLDVVTKHRALVHISKDITSAPGLVCSICVFPNFNYALGCSDGTLVECMDGEVLPEVLELSSFELIRLFYMVAIDCIRFGVSFDPRAMARMQHEKGVCSFTFFNDPELVITADLGGTVYFWGCGNKLIEKTKAHKCGLTVVECSSYKDIYMPLLQSTLGEQAYCDVVVTFNKI